jgi:tRNA/rRNA methyltransferase
MVPGNNLSGNFVMNAVNDFVFVLVRPREAGNLGAAARALKNFGFGSLRIAGTDPRAQPAARVMAVHAADLLDEARVYPDLPAAVADCNIVVATTARSGRYRAAAATPRAIAAELAAGSRHHRVAIVFGPEDHGLSNDDLKLCHRIVTIPSDPLYSSLNLAQAVVIIAYELRLAIDAGGAPSPPTAHANAADIAAMFERMARALVAIGFLSESNPDHIMFALRGLLGRTGLAPRELDILNGIARQIDWFAAGGYRTAEIKQREGRRLR